MPVDENKIFLNSPNFSPFCPLLGLDFCKVESPFPIVGSYQIWLKSVQWFWRRNCLKEKFTDDGQWMIPIAHFSILLRRA